mgnify:CR=1 FL=1
MCLRNCSSASSKNLTHNCFTPHSFSVCVWLVDFLLRSSAIDPALTSLLSLNIIDFSAVGVVLLKYSVFVAYSRPYIPVSAYHGWPTVSAMTHESHGVVECYSGDDIDLAKFLATDREINYSSQHCSATIHILKNRR